MDAYERKMMTNVKGGTDGLVGEREDESVSREGQESRMVVEVIKNRSGVSPSQDQTLGHAHFLFRDSHQRHGSCSIP